jgi:tight adherence protein C
MTTNIADILPIAIATCLFLVLLLICLSAYQFYKGRASRRKLLEKVNPSVPVELSRPVMGKDQKSVFKPFLSIFTKIGRHKKPPKDKNYSKLSVKFYRAGWYGPGVFAVFWGAKIFFAVLLPTLFYLIFNFVGFQLVPIYTLFIMGLLALLGLNLPSGWLALTMRFRKEKLFRAFPDAMDLLVICIEAGVGMDAAFKRVGSEIALTHPELSQELKIYSQELRIGRERREALRNLAQRTNIQDVRSLVSLVIQTDRFGTSVADALKVYADTFREKRMQRAEEKASKLPGKMIVVAMMFIFPVIYVVTLGPFILSAIEVFKK